MNADFSLMQQQRRVSEIQRTIDNLPLKVQKRDFAARNFIGRKMSQFTKYRAVSFSSYVLAQGQILWDTAYFQLLIFHYFMNYGCTASQRTEVLTEC